MPELIPLFGIKIAKKSASGIFFDKARQTENKNRLIPVFCLYFANLAAILLPGNRMLFFHDFPVVKLIVRLNAEQVNSRIQSGQIYGWRQCKRLQLID